MGTNWSQEEINVRFHDFIYDRNCYQMAQKKKKQFEKTYVGAVSQSVSLWRKIKPIEMLNDNLDSLAARIVRTDPTDPNDSMCSNFSFPDLTLTLADVM